MIGVRKSRTFQEEFLAFPKKHGVHFDEEPLGSAAPDHTEPYGTVLLRDASRHFVPGYDRVVPPGQYAFAESQFSSSSSSFVLGLMC
jgi:hypothetical protein